MAIRMRDEETRAENRANIDVMHLQYQIIIKSAQMHLRDKICQCRPIQKRQKDMAGTHLQQASRLLGDMIKDMQESSDKISRDEWLGYDTAYKRRDSARPNRKEVKIKSMFGEGFCKYRFLKHPYHQ